jgi:hypothetical protein
LPFWETSPAPGCNVSRQRKNATITWIVDVTRRFGKLRPQRRSGRDSFLKALVGP